MSAPAWPRPGPWNEEQDDLMKEETKELDESKKQDDLEAFAQRLRDEMRRSLRTFLPMPRLAASWTEYDEKTAEWWELYLDLIMVASFKNVSDGLKEAGINQKSLIDFMLVFAMMLIGWYQFTTWTARFSDNSLTSSACSYLFFVGTAGVGLASAPTDLFFCGALIQRLAIFAINTIPYYHFPRTRKHLRLSCYVTALSVIVIAVGGLELIPPRAALLACCIVELPLRHVLNSRNLPSLGTEATPMNIDHISERMGCMIMVVLGETVLSSVVHRAADDALAWQLYINVAISLVVTFSVATYYFTLTPPRELHAGSRSIWCGQLYAEVHLVLFTALLLQGNISSVVVILLTTKGVGIKFVTEALTKGTLLSSTEANLLFYSLAVAKAAMLGIRVLHFGFREAINDRAVRRVRKVWWTATSIAPGLPLVGLYLLKSESKGGQVRPLNAVLVLASTILLFILVEQAIMACLMHYYDKVTVLRPNYHRKQQHHPPPPPSSTSSSSGSGSTTPRTDYGSTMAVDLENALFDV